MYLRTLTPEELKRVYETDLTEAFPPAELKPLWPWSGCVKAASTTRWS